MQNSRSNLLRPVVSLLALLVVALMMVFAPGVASARGHGVAFKRAVIALGYLDHQVTVDAATLRRVERRLKVLKTQRRAPLAAQVRDRKRERAGLAATQTALLADAAALREHSAHARALRGIVLTGLALKTRGQVLAAVRQRTRSHAPATRRLVSDVPLEAPVAAGENGAAVAALLSGEELSPPASGVGAVAAAFAMTQLGRAYHYSGYSPATGFDCSGLVSWAFSKAGHDIPHQSAAIWSLGKRVPLTAVMPGDIVSFGGQGHIGIYLGRGLYVHSPQSGDVVRVQRVRDHLNFDGVIRIG
jgi:peptidoglycan DL-endopeptidase CwlO